MPPPAKSTVIVSQDFAKPNLPRHSTNGSKRSRASSVHSPSVRLSIIEEDAAHPSIPPRAHHRPFHRRWNLGDPPRSSFESPPPKYSVWDTMGPKGEKLGDVRNNKHIARRGGWRRICLIMLILLTLVVGLAVGLSIGLRKQNSQQEQQPSPQPASSSSTPSTSPFPAGSYTLSTHLATILTDCTSNPTLWSCYPSNQTYSASPSKSSANLTWTISSSPSSPSTFTISSTSGVFSLGSFASTPLIKLAAGTDQERYHFSTESAKQTFPNLGVNCFFNSTVVEGDLYTRKPKTFPTTSAAEKEDDGTNSNNEFKPWPFAVDIRQRVAGGLNTPQCFRMQGSKQGDRIIDGITPRPESATCSCEYRNFGT
ncbi:MAG: hypothetical protein Q9223_005293 [Gallowayella weberi]